MPELPEVETTVRGLNQYVKGLSIIDIWTDYGSTYHAGKKNIKDKDYFTYFKNTTAGEKIVQAERIGKNVLIHLSGDKTIVIHMKMTGHLLYGAYEKLPSINTQFPNKSKTSNIKKEARKTWEPKERNGPLRDPFNRFVHLVFTLSNEKHLVFSDMRKFGKVFVTKTGESRRVVELDHLGPDPLSKAFRFYHFKERLSQLPQGKIKQALMNQEIISGIGNIYSDEILLESGIHPLSVISKIPEAQMRKMFDSTKKILRKGIDFGGDSMSDYRNIKGERGYFQHAHNAYRLTRMGCKKKGCAGKIERMKIGGRNAHFCNIHQKKFNY